MDQEIKKTQFRIYARSSDGFKTKRDTYLLRKFMLFKLSQLFFDNAPIYTLEEFVQVNKEHHNVMVDVWYDIKIVDKFKSRAELINLLYKFYFEYVEQRNRRI